MGHDDTQPEIIFDIQYFDGNYPWNLQDNVYLPVDPVELDRISRIGGRVFHLEQVALTGILDDFPDEKKALGISLEKLLGLDVPTTLIAFGPINGDDYYVEIPRVVDEVI